MLDPIRVEEIFAQAVSRPTQQECAAWLDAACGADAELRARVEQLLAAHGNDANFLPLPASTAEPPVESAGLKIGRYQLLEQIGEGGFGVVFMAEQTAPVRRRVALKIIKLGMDTKQVVARFEAERQALAMMDHENIARVFDAGATETGRPYFVMELVRGVPITTYCDDNKLATRERLKLFIQVCSAVQHAHQKGIIHRDLKPSNVLVTMHDDRAVPKVIDFGVAKAMQGRLTDHTLFTEFRQMIGTPAYMSPEQAQMSGLDIDTRSDIYSLGVLLYELLTGTTPFDTKQLHAASFDQLQRLICDTEPPRPSTRLGTLAADRQLTTAGARGTDARRLTQSIRGDLDWIVMKCLEKDRNRRYETANALCRDVERYLADEAVHARPPSQAYRAAKFVRRNKKAALAAGAIMAALMIGLTIALLALVQARREATRADREASNARTHAARSEQVAAFLGDMLEGAGPAVARGRDAALLTEILDKTAERIANLKDQPLVEAELRHTIGKVYSALGEYTKAEPMQGGAVRLLTKALGTDHPKVASALTAWSNSLWEAGQEADAEQVARDALALHRKTSGSQNLEVAALLHTLGFQLTNRGRLTEGEHLLREELHIRQKLLGDADVAVASSWEFLAANLWRQGKLVEAEDSCRRAIAIQRQAFGDVHPELANALGTLSTILQLQGRLPEAEDVRRQTLQVRRKIHPDYHFAVIHDFDFLNDLLLAQAKQSEAEANFREMLGILSKAVESNPNKPDTINLLAWKLTTCPFTRLRDPTRAVALAHRAVAAAPQNGNFWNTLGVAQCQAHDFHGALASLDRSMELRAGGDPDDWFALAMAYWQLGEKQKAHEWYEKAAEWTDKNKPHIEQIRRFRAEAAQLLGIPQTQPSAAPAATTQP